MNSLGTIIATHRKKMGLSQKELAETLNKYGYSQSNKAVWSWEKGVTEPSGSLLMILCEILHITDIYNEFFGKNPDNPLSLLNEEGQAKAIEYIELLKTSGKYTPAQTVIIPFRKNIRLFDLPASAGTGSFLDGENYTILEVGEEVPVDADFGIRISGDSMEPQFISGQIVWVHQQETLSTGEIGIFYLNGNAYCKKLKDEGNGLFLTSLNTKYEPIAVKDTDSFKIFGKIVG